jgi:ectoine hydroxylase-related dioxygenase (phytanoyl-CoA dioxygenase family)
MAIRSSTNTLAPVFQNTTLEAAIKEHGFYVYENLFSAEQVAQARTLFDALCTVDGRRGFHNTLFEPEAAHRKAVFEGLKPLFDAVVLPLTADYRTLITSFPVKEAQTAEAFGLHQDLTFLDESRYQTLGIWAPLVDTSVQNGGLQVVPKSHRWLQTIRYAPYMSAPFEPWRKQLTAASLPLTLRAGDAVLYDLATLHYSPPNLTDERRVVMAGVFVPNTAATHYYYRPAQTPDQPLERYATDEAFFWHFRLGERPAGKPEAEIEYQNFTLEPHHLAQFLGVPTEELEQPNHEVVHSKDIHQPGFWQRLKSRILQSIDR